MKKYLMREIMRGEKLTVMQDRINKAAANGMISMEDKEELDKALHAKANPDDNRPDVYEMVKALEARVKALEDKAGVTVQPEPGDDGNTSGYPAWKPWNGYEYFYTGGEIVYHNGKLWENITTIPNTWEPGADGTSGVWREYTA